MIEVLIPSANDLIFEIECENLMFFMNFAVLNCAAKIVGIFKFVGWFFMF